MAWLTSQSVATLVIGCLLIGGAVAVGSRFAAQRLVGAADRDEGYSIAAPLMSPLGAAFAILAALTLVNEAGYLTSAESITSDEAADASRLAWAATTQGVQGHTIQTALARYLVATRRF